MKQLLLMTLIGLIAFTPGQAHARDQTELDGTPIAGDVYASFNTNWRKYAVFINELDGGGFVVIPSYNRRLESSRGISPSQAMEELKVERTERQGNLTRKRVKFPDRADAEAYSRALPKMEVGQYGWVASAEVVKIIDRKQMIVKEVWLVDRPTLREAYEKDRERSARQNNGEADEQQLRFDYGERINMMDQQGDRDEGFREEFRLVGFDTRGLRVGERWKGDNDEGFKIAVAHWEEPEPEEGETRRRRKEDPRLVLTEVDDLMRRSIDEQGFKELLDERGMTVAAFVDLIRTLRDRDRRNAEERVFNTLLPPDLSKDR